MGFYFLCQKRFSDFYYLRMKHQKMKFCSPGTQPVAMEIGFVNPIAIKTFHQARGFLPITLEVIKVHIRNFVTFPKI